MRNIQSSVGCTGKTTQSYQAPALMKNLGGFNFRIVCGYPGSAEFVLAMQRGEVDMVSSVWLQWHTAHTDEIAKGSMVPVVQTGLRRNHELPDLPLMQEVIDDPASKRVIEFVSTSLAIGRALMVPPEVPADRIAALRVAFEAVVRDPAFLKDAGHVKAQIDATSGEEVQRVVDAIFDAPKDILEKAKLAMD